MEADIVEYIGLNKAQSTLIECHRRSPAETKSEIIERVMSAMRPAGQSRPIASADGWFDLGQGARLHVGEKPLLFLSEGAKRRRSPDAVAEIRSDGFYMDGKKVAPSNGSVLQPSMKIVQERKGYRNSKGEIISLSAWRQWHVLRDGKLLSMLELKDPNLARKRGRIEMTLEDLKSPDEHLEK
jgi:hypothetical protein